MKTTILAVTTALTTITLAAPAAPPDLVEAHQKAFHALKEFRDALVPRPVIQFVETFPPVAQPRAAVLKLVQAEPARGRVETPETDERIHEELEQAHKEIEKAQKEVAKQQEEIAKHHKQIMKMAQAGAADRPGSPAAPEPPVDPAALADWANHVAVATTHGALANVFGGGRSVRRPVMVGGEARDFPTLEEDLNVMMRILEKSAGAKDDNAKAMGIDVFMFGGSSSPQVFYLEDYGALFVLKVKFPLLAPPSPDEETEKTEPRSTEWERARQEVYGTGNPWQKDVGFLSREGTSREEFDAERVEKLRKAIIEDLANARHIRNLQPNEKVTVVILGSGPRVVSVKRGEGTSGAERGGAGLGSRVGGVSFGSGSGYARSEVRMTGRGAGQSTMTIQARKSDIDAFGAGELSGEEFTKKVSVQVY